MDITTPRIITPEQQRPSTMMAARSEQPTAPACRAWRAGIIHLQEGTA